MTFTTALIFVLAMSSTSSASPDNVEKLMEQISDEIIADIVVVAKAAEAHHIGTEELYKGVVEVIRKDLIRANPQVMELEKLGGTAEGLANNLALKIMQNKDLQAILRSEVPKFRIKGIGKVLKDVLENIAGIAAGEVIASIFKENKSPD